MEMIEVEFVRYQKKEDYITNKSVIWRRISDNSIVECRNTDLVKFLKPKPAEFYQAYFKKLDKDRMLFPVRFVGINIKKDVSFDHTYKLPVITGHKPNYFPLKKTTPLEKIEGLNEVILIYKGEGNPLGNKNRYYIFQSIEQQAYKHLFVTTNNKGMFMFFMRPGDRVKIKFRNIYLRPGTMKTDHNYKNASGEFPYYIENITRGNIVRYNDENYKYEEH